MIKVYEDQIAKIYENIKAEETSALKLRKEEISKRLPAVIEIERKIARICINLSMNILKNSDGNSEDYLKDLKEKITDLRIHKSELLVQHGYSIDYLEIRYRCPKCKDTGYIGDVPCSCYKQKLVQLYYKDSELKDMLAANNFDYFNFNFYSIKRSPGEPDSPRKNMEKIVSRIQSFISGFSESSDNYLFFGSSGTGKTFLSNCVAKELMDKGYLVVYRTAEDLIQNLRQIRFSANNELEDLLMNCDLLIVDDLGTEQINEFSRMELFNILNKKLLRHKKMLFSTNSNLEDLFKIYTERITSRLMGDFIQCKFYGEDIRIKKKYLKQQTGASL